MDSKGLIRKAMTRTQYKYWKWYAKEGKSCTWIARRYGKSLPMIKWRSSPKCCAPFGRGKERRAEFVLC